MREERRRLAAILAADVAGYSRLMAADESDTLARLRQIRAEVLEPKIARFHGRVVGSAGDSLLVEFASAVEAVKCAVELQEELEGRNAGVPEERRMAFRMGVNLGDVIAEDGTIHGDGVNVAARLEKLADPGGVCIGRAIYDQVKGKLAYAYDDLGEQRVHNIPEPVHAFRVRPASREAAGKAPRPSVVADKSSIVVLPFANTSGDPEQQYFSDGITEDIITELSRFRQLQLIARNASFEHRGHEIDVARVGRELGVQFLVEGSVRRLGERIRITAQLTDAATRRRVWAERFDCNQNDLFAIQDAIVRRIAGTLVGRVEAANIERAKRKPPASLAAYECVLRGGALPFGDSSVDAERRRMFEQAIALDPEYGQAYALLALVVFLDWWTDMTESDLALDHAFELARKAVALDENDPTALHVLGWMHLHRKSFQLAEDYFSRAVELNPNDPEELAEGGFLYAYLGRPDEAIDWLKRATLADPFYNPIKYWHYLGYAHFIARRYEEAIASLNHSSTMPFWVKAYLAASYALMSNFDRAREIAAQVLRAKPAFSSTRFVLKEPFKRLEDREHLLDGLRKAGLPE